MRKVLIFGAVFAAGYLWGTGRMFMATTKEMSRAEKDHL